MYYLLCILCIVYDGVIDNIISLTFNNILHHHIFFLPAATEDLASIIQSPNMHSEADPFLAAAVF